MSDFYQQIGKKLQEEGRFPNREKNWRTLAKRLDAYKQGRSVIPTPHTSMWKIAATLLLLLSAWLGWSLHQTRVENAMLADQLVALSYKDDPSAQAIVRNNGGSDTGSEEERRSKSEETSPDIVEAPAVSVSGKPKVNVNARKRLLLRPRLEHANQRWDNSSPKPRELESDPQRPEIPDWLRARTFLLPTEQFETSEHPPVRRAVRQYSWRVRWSDQGFLS